MTANQGDGRTDDPVHRTVEPTWQPQAPGFPAHPSAPDPTLDPSFDDDPEVRPSAASRAVSIVLALVVGIVYGAVGTVAHPLTVTIATIVVPWGLIVSLVGVLALFVGFRLVLGERLAVIAAAVGVVGIVALFSLESTGGSILIQQGLSGQVWVLAPALLGALVVFWPSLPERRTARAGDQHPGAADRLTAPDEKEFPTP